MLLMYADAIQMRHEGGKRASRGSVKEGCRWTIVDFFISVREGIETLRRTVDALLVRDEDLCPLVSVEQESVLHHAVDDESPEHAGALPPGICVT